MLFFLVCLFLDWLWYAPRPDCSQDGSFEVPSSPELKFLTLNLHRLPLDVTGPSWPWFRLTTWRDRYAHEFDIVGFQELFEDLQKQTFLTSLRPKLAHISRGAPWSGLAIVSRYRLSHTGFVAFRASSGSDSLASKGVQHALAHCPQGSIWVVNTHLQSGRGGAEEALRRTSQVPQLVQLIQTLRRKKNYPVLLLGDFNLDEASLEYQDLSLLLDRRLGLRDVSKGLFTAGAHTSLENKVSNFQEKESLKLDYVWASKGIRVGEVRSRPFPLARFWYVSDHFGVEAHLKLEEFLGKK